MPADSSKTLFGTLAAKLIEEQNRTFREVAAQVPNLPYQMFTKWKRGDWTTIPKIEEIVKVIAPNDHRAQCDLIIAYLTDLTPLGYRPTIEIGQRGETVGGNMKPMGGPGSTLSEEMQSRFETMREAYVLDDEFANMMNQLEAWSRRIVKERAGKQPQRKTE